MSSSLSKKLGLKPGFHATVLNAPSGYVDALSVEALDVTFEPNDMAGEVDFVQLFVKDSGELESCMPAAMKCVKRDGLFWVCYPKKTSKIKSDLHRDILNSKVGEYGYTGVSLISVDDTWSAMRFRPSDLVGTTRKSQ